MYNSVLDENIIQRILHAKSRSLNDVKWRVKVKFSLDEVMKAQRGSNGISLLFL